MEKWGNIASNIQWKRPVETYERTRNVLYESSKTARNERIPPPPPLESRWPRNEPYNVRKHLFMITPDKKFYPAYKSTPDVYKGIIDAYVAWYKIPQQAMPDFWLDFVDALLLCHEFEDKAPVDFKAWAYGIAVRYVLVDRQRKRSEQLPYDPEHNFLL
jgi:hypothetical protein